MTRDRSSSTIRMPDGEPACEPSQHCWVRVKCMRYLAHITKGTEPRDFSVETDGGTALCPGYRQLPVQPRRRAG